MLSALLLLGACAAISLLASELPRPLAWPGALAAMGWGVHLFRRERARAAQSFVLRGDGSPVRVDGEPVQSFALEWRGPLAFATWRDGRGLRHRCAWWPDTLPAPWRRELRLAAPATKAARGRPSMAP